jgi:hypothetical protein
MTKLFHLELENPERLETIGKYTVDIIEVDPDAGIAKCRILIGPITSDRIVQVGGRVEERVHKPLRREDDV